MPTRSIAIDGRSWRVFPSGRVTQLDRDEFALLFIAEPAAGRSREVRVSRYSPLATRSREQSLAELSDDDLTRLFRASQPGATSPEADYSA